MSDPATILALWEAGQGPAGGRAARLLASMGEADPAGLTLGAATRRLVGLRRRLFGDALVCLAACPACGEMNEAAISAPALLAAPAGAATVEAEAEGWRATARQPTLTDFADAAACPDAEAAAALLRERAMLAVARPATADAEAPLPEALIAAAEAALDAAEPLADPRVACTCAACGAAWDIAFDPAAFLAEELAAAARRDLAEVAALARAYGWSEAAILAMPAARRRLYLELAG